MPNKRKKPSDTDAPKDVHEGPFFLLHCDLDKYKTVYVLPSVTTIELEYLKRLQNTHDYKKLLDKDIAQEDLEAYMYVAATLEEQEDALGDINDDKVVIGNRKECTGAWGKWFPLSQDFAVANEIHGGNIQGVFYYHCLNDIGVSMRILF
jgi:hypothetical protein